MAAGAAPAATAARDKRGESYRKPPPEKNRRRYSASPAMLKFFLTFILIATITSALVAQTPKPEATQYTCVMHPEIVQDHWVNVPNAEWNWCRRRQITNTQHRTPNIQRPSQRRLTETPN